jgi:hypothetical protein
MLWLQCSGQMPSVSQYALPNGVVAKPQLCSTLLPSSSSQADGCPEYWFKDNVRYNYRQTYSSLPTDNGDVCNMAGESTAATAAPRISRLGLTFYKSS